MKLPDSMEIVVFADGRPASGMFVGVDIQVSRRNDFALWFGPSDERGKLMVTREDLLAEARREHELFLMDYGDPEEDATGVITLRPINRSGLEAARKAFDLFSGVTEYRPGYKEQLESAIAALDRSRPRQLALSVTYRGYEGRIATKVVDNQ